MIMFTGPLLRIKDNLFSYQGSYWTWNAHAQHQQRRWPDLK